MRGACSHHPPPTLLRLSCPLLNQAALTFVSRIRRVVSPVNVSPATLAHYASSILMSVPLVAVKTGVHVPILSMDTNVAARPVSPGSTAR